MKAMMDRLEVRYQQNKEDEMVVEFGVFALAAYLAALRGNEVAMANLGEMRKLRTVTDKFQTEHPHASFVLQGHKESRGHSNHTHVLT